MTRPHAVQFVHQDEHLHRPVFHLRTRETDHGLDQAFRVIDPGRAIAPCPEYFRITLNAQQIFPKIQVGRDMRLAVGVKLYPGDQQNQTLIRAEGMTRWAWSDVRYAQGLIEALQSAGL